MNDQNYRISLMRMMEMYWTRPERIAQRIPVLERLKEIFCQQNELQEHDKAFILLFAQLLLSETDEILTKPKQIIMDETLSMLGGICDAYAMRKEIKGNKQLITALIYNAYELSDMVNDMKSDLGLDEEEEDLKDVIGFDSSVIGKGFM